MVLSYIQYYHTILYNKLLPSLQIGFYIGWRWTSEWVPPPCLVWRNYFNRIVHRWYNSSCYLYSCVWDTWTYCLQWWEAVVPQLLLTFKKSSCYVTMSSSAVVFLFSALHLHLVNAVETITVLLDYHSVKISLVCVLSVDKLLMCNCYHGNPITCTC